MKTMVDQMAFPPVGKRSLLVRFYPKNIRFAYYLTNGLIFLAILLVFSYIKLQQWQYQRRLKSLGPTMGKKVITLTYAQLGPPPSLMGEEVAPTGATGARPAAPVIGAPKPVPDEQAIEETSPTQDVIAGTSPLATGTGGTGTIVQIDTSIPDINAFVPYEKEPKVVYKPPIVYPEIARLVGQEGTVFVKALVDTDGLIMRVVVIKGSEYPVLDTAAVEHVSKWKMTPALQRDRPVRVWIGVPVRFVLEQK